MASLFGLGGSSDKKNRGVVYKGAYKVAVEEIPYPSFEMTIGGKKRNMPHAAILKVVASNICGSDGHMYRGRTGVTPGTIFGHEITGEVAEIGSDVECIQVGDLVSVPFNIACGRCKNCKKQKTNLCLNVNPEQPGGAYGYVSMGGWPGGQSEYVLVPYADFNLLKIDKDLGMKRILDVAMLSDILPTGYDAAVRSMVGTGSTVYIAGAGPVGICCAASCFSLGASSVIVADYEPDRLKQCKLMGCDIIDLNTTKSIPEAIETILGETTCDSAIDCVGFEACGHHGNEKKSVEQKSEVLNTCFEVAKPGGFVGVPGVYMPSDVGGDKDKFSCQGGLALYYGHGWNKGLTIAQGQCPVMRYNEDLKSAVLSGRLEVAKYLNINLISLDEAPGAYEDFSRGANKKYVIDPHNMVSKHLVTK